MATMEIGNRPALPKLDVDPRVTNRGKHNWKVDWQRVAQGVSLRGEPLYSAPPAEAAVAKFRAAREASEADPANADNLIWYGRWAGYTGNYREAIRIFTEGTSKFPGDARFYRHRGHRYISIREFDRAIQDFEKAATLIQGKPDEVEPDGAPNARNIPISTLHSNIWYHLGLAYYLKHDLDNALRACRKGLEASNNDDKIVSQTHWVYMTLRLQGKDEEAKRVLEPIRKDMNIIENTAYHRLLLFYKGELTLTELTGTSLSGIMNDAIAYGVGNWHYYNGRRDEARKVFESLLKNAGWASFGYIAAEADMVRAFGR
jgi:tetratricopeptide (TPR) repeat protein